MKLSVSLTEEDVRALDALAEERALPSRSAVVQVAIRQLRRHSLGEDYAVAFQEWDESEDARLWDRTAGDGMPDASR